MAKAKASKMSARRSTSVQRKRRPGTTKTAKRAAPARRGRRAVTPAARAATTARTTPGTATSAKTSAPAGSYRAKVRMYRQGLGDCFPRCRGWENRCAGGDTRALGPSFGISSSCRFLYWGPGDEAPAWRSVDDAWLDSSSELALALDGATNNTSLVLAIELAGGDVLLFAGDAQVGNWESWQDLSWTVDGKSVTGPDLLKRSIFYKVGHHGSHNATLKKDGLELMTNLHIAAIPVDHEMAVKKHWGRMPLPELVTALGTKTGGKVVRIDQGPETPIHGVVETERYFDIAI